MNERSRENEKEKSETQRIAEAEAKEATNQAVQNTHNKNSKNEADLKAALDSTLTVLASEIGRSYSELKGRLSNPIAYLVSITVGMLLIAVSVCAPIVVSLIPSLNCGGLSINTLPTLISGVVIFLVGVILDSVQRLGLVRDFSKSANELSRELAERQLLRG